MELLLIVLGFLLPVVLVFGYSVWSHRRRQTPGASKFTGDPDNKTFDQSEVHVGKDSFRKAVEAHQLDNMVAAFAEDAVLHSPVSFKPVEGRAAIRSLLTVLMEVFQDFRYTDQLESTENTRGLIFRTRVGDCEVEGLDLLRFDESGRIRDFTVMVRPRSAVEALRAEVGSRLAKVASE